MKSRKGTLFYSEEYTRNYINENSSPIEIMGFKYQPGRVLYEMDMIAFNELEKNLIDSLLSDGTIEHDDDDDYVWAID